MRRGVRSFDAAKFPPTGQLHHLLMRQRLQLPVSADRHGAAPMTAFRIFGDLARRSAWGHEERFAPRRLSARYRFRKETIAGASRNGRDAPIRPFGDKQKFAGFGPQNCRSGSATRWLMVTPEAALRDNCGERRDEWKLTLAARAPPLTFGRLSANVIAAMLLADPTCTLEAVQAKGEGVGIRPGPLRSGRTIAGGRR